MTTPLEQVLTTRSTLEFFIILAGNLPGTLERTNNQEHGYGFRLTIKQPQTWFKNGIQLFGVNTTHTFELYQDETLSWAMQNEPTLTDLLTIQQRLRRLIHQNKLPQPNNT